MTKRVAIEVGWDVFVEDGATNFGTVRDIHSSYLVVFIEGHGDAVIDAKAVRDVHHQKVIVELEALAEEVQEAIGHAHDKETYEPEDDIPQPPS